MSARANSAGVCAVVIAALVLAIGVGNASAGAFSVSTQTFRNLYAPITMRGSGGGTFTVNCTVSLEGSFYDRTFSTTGPLEIGVINGASIVGCDAEEVTVSFLTETLPWSIVYTGFTGTLPNIATMTFEFRGMRMLVAAGPFIACLYRTTQATPARYTWTLERGVVTREAFEAATTIPRLSRLHEDVFFTCAESIQLAGSKNQESVVLNLI